MHCGQEHLDKEEGHLRSAFKRPSAYAAKSPILRPSGLAPVCLFWHSLALFSTQCHSVAETSRRTDRGILCL